MYSCPDVEWSTEEFESFSNILSTSLPPTSIDTAAPVPQVSSSSDTPNEHIFEDSNGQAPAPESPDSPTICPPCPLASVEEIAQRPIARANRRNTYIHNQNATSF